MKFCLGQTWLEYFCCTLSLLVKFIKNRLKEEILPGAKVTKIFLLHTFLASKISLKQEITNGFRLVCFSLIWFHNGTGFAVVSANCYYSLKTDLNRLVGTLSTVISTMTALLCRSSQSFISSACNCVIAASLLKHKHSQWRWDTVSNIQKLQCSVAVITCKQIWNKIDC